jgi:hypothetical protein
MRYTLAQTDHRPRLGATLLLGVSFALAMATAGVAHAQGHQYTFTRIADTVQNDAALAGVYCVGLNNLGTVIVTFFPTGTSFLQLWRGDGSLQSFMPIAPDVSSVCASINDLDETAYADPRVPPGQSMRSTAFVNLGSRSARTERNDRGRMAFESAVARRMTRKVDAASRTQGN